MVAICGGAFFALRQSVSSLESELLKGDRGFARLLGGLRTSGGRIDFRTLSTFVESSDRPEVGLGLVYAIVLDNRGKVVHGALNPRLFASLGAEFQALVLQGRQRVLELLAAGKVDRRNRIREFNLAVDSGRLRVGFDLSRIDRSVNAVYLVGVGILGGLLVLGVLAACLVARGLAAPVRRLAREAAAAAKPLGKEQLPGGGDIPLISGALERLRSAVAEREGTQQQLSPYLGEALVERILREASPLDLATEERAVTALSLAFHGFSTVTLDLKGTEALHLINEYLAPVIDAVSEQQGIVTQLDSARMVAVWGFPRPVKDPELCAVRSAFAAREAVLREARRQATVGGTVLEACIGISSGRAAAGNLGSMRRVVYTVLGAAVELACWVELQAQPGEILANEAAFSKVRGQVTGVACAPLIFEGLEEAVPLYRLEAGTGTVL